MAHICKQSQTEDVSNGKSGTPDVHMNVYRCGGCNLVFETICVLHAHMQTHSTGCSYHFDFTLWTAFPKYGSICTGSQTDFDEKNSFPSTTTGSQTDLDINAINNILQHHSNVTGNHYFVSGDNTSLETRDHISFQKTEHDVKTNIERLEYLHDAASSYLEKNDISSDLYDKAEAEFERPGSVEERVIKVEKCDENMDEDDDDQTFHLGESDDDTYLNQTYYENPGNDIFFEKNKNLKKYDFVKVDIENEKSIQDKEYSLGSRQPLFRCQICEKLLSSSNSLKRHVTLMHSERKSGKNSSTYRCKYCDFDLKSKKELLKHIREDHSETNKTFSCPYCEEEFLTNATKSSHMDSEHPEIVEVLKKFHESKDMDTHTPCDMCGKLFSTAAGLALHMSSIHLKKKFKCDICNAELSQKFTLKAHKIEKHHEDMRGFDCNICKKTFAYQFRLKAHIEQMHTPQEGTSNKYICETCGFSSKSKAGLRYHLTKHDEQRKQYKCSVCPYITYYKCSMSEHMRSHEGDRRFICDVCGDKFFTCKQLKVHMRRHTGELPYQCEVCSKRFRTDIAYARHRDIHLNKMRFKCEFCDKEFVQKTNCLAHMRQHTGEKPFKCDWCGQGFTHNVSRKNHMSKCTHKPSDFNLTETSSLT